MTETNDKDFVVRCAPFGSAVTSADAFAFNEYGYGAALSTMEANGIIVLEVRDIGYLSVRGRIH